jgi:ubiquinone/menaquinone biosynthesis C-methylase UbiE
MPDPYAAIADADLTVQERLADVLELRAADPQQQAILREHLSGIDVPRGARALEVGCGTGAVSRALARSLNVAVTGVDPSPVFVARARKLGNELPALTFLQGDGRSLCFREASFDLVVFHTTLCHVPDPRAGLLEAMRVLQPDGWLTVLECDYTTTSIAVDAFDRLQPVVEAMVANFVHDPWLTRRLPGMLASMGFEVQRLRSHGYLQTSEPTYMLTLIDRGADLLSKAGSIGANAASAFRDEAQRQADAGEFFGHMSFLGVIARKRPSRGGA